MILALMCFFLAMSVSGASFGGLLLNFLRFELAGLARPLKAFETFAKFRGEISGRKFLVTLSQV
jgi:hypothetical protein